MSDEPSTLTRLLARVRDRQPRAADAAPQSLVSEPDSAVEVYRNRRPHLAIDFQVARLAFAGAEVLDPRVVRIAPGAANERHRHAHESLFVVLSGRGGVCIDETWVPLREGQIAFVPRWGFHQTRNESLDEELVLLAITDFGLTSAVVGDYDRRTRMGAEDGHPGGA